MREQYDGWQKTTHHAVATCNDCHVPHDLIGKYMAKVEHGYRHSKGFTFQDFHEPIRSTDKDRVIDYRERRGHAFMLGATPPMLSPIARPESTRALRASWRMRWGQRMARPSSSRASRRCEP